VGRGDGGSGSARTPLSLSPSLSPSLSLSLSLALALTLCLVLLSRPRSLGRSRSPRTGLAAARLTRARRLVSAARSARQGPPGGGFGAFGLGGGGAGGGGGALPADDSASALAPLPCEIAVQVVGGAHAGSTGHIAQVRGARGDAYAVVIVGADGVRVVECSRRELEPTTPGKKDAIVILHGDLVHSTGVLIGVDGTDGIIKMDTTNDIKIVELRSCAKLVRVGAS
jgi:hypothetical protein